MRKTKEEAAITRQNILAAARRVFHKNGVAHSSLELVAKEAGLTRGAIYWHFKDKTALFFAMQQDICEVLDAQIQASFDDPHWQNPLDAIAAGLKTFFSVLENNSEVRKIFEIMALKCEYVGEFENVIKTLMEPANHLLRKLEDFYQKAHAQKMLRVDLNPHFSAIDTAIFVNGLVHYWASGEIKNWESDVNTLIDTHMALRRA